MGDDIQMEMYDYWLTKGRSDARQNVPYARIKAYFDFEEDAFSRKNLFFYRMGRAQIAFADNPTRLKLLNEIYELLRETHFPKGRITVSTSHYSHRLLKKVFIELGYRVQNKPVCMQFYVFPM